MALKKIITESSKGLLGETRAQGMMNSAIWMGCSLVSSYDKAISERSSIVISGALGTIGLATAYNSIKPKTDAELWQEGLDKYKKWSKKD